MSQLIGGSLPEIRGQSLQSVGKLPSSTPQTGFDVSPPSSRLQPYLSQAQDDLNALREVPERASTASAQASNWTKDLRPDPSAPQRPPVQSQGELQQALGVDGNWRGAENVRKLLSELGSMPSVITDRFGPTFQEPASGTLACLGQVAQRHGLAKLNQICGTLLNFMTQAESAGWRRWDAARLVRFALEDIADPSIINQRSKGTCGAAAIQMKLAAEKPEQYLEMLTQLTLGKPYRAPDGSLVKPDMSWQGDNSDDRRPTDKVMQSTLMVMARGSYNSSADDGENNTGMTRKQQLKVLQSLFDANDEFDLDESLFNTGLEARYLWRLIEDDLARGRVVSVTFDGHAVQVVGVDKSVNPPNVLLLTWGQRKLMALPDFLEHVRSVNSVDDSGLDNRKVEGRRVNG